LCKVDFRIKEVVNEKKKQILKNRNLSLDENLRKIRECNKYYRWVNRDGGLSKSVG